MWHIEECAKANPTKRFVIGVHLPLSDMPLAQWMRHHYRCAVPYWECKDSQVFSYVDIIASQGNEGLREEGLRGTVPVVCRTFSELSTYQDTAALPCAQSMRPTSSSLVRCFSSARLVSRPASAATRCCRTHQQAAMASATDIPRVLSIQSHVVHGYVVGAGAGARHGCECALVTACPVSRRMAGSTYAMLTLQLLQPRSLPTLHLADAACRAGSVLCSHFSGWASRWTLCTACSSATTQVSNQCEHTATLVSLSPPPLS